MHRIFSGSIRKTLTILIVVAILPALLIIVSVGIEHRQHTIEETQREVSFVSESMAHIHKGYISSTHQMLAALARSSEVRSFNSITASAVFKSLVDNDSAYINIIAADKEGNVFASALPFTPTNLADRPHFQQAIQERRFVVGEYIVTRVGQHLQGLPFAYPVLDNTGEVIAILATAMHLEHLAHSFDVTRLPENSFIAVTDGRGIRLFMHPSKEATNPIGQPITKEAWEIVRQEKKPGVSTHAGSDGVRRIFAFHPVLLSDNAHPSLFMWAAVPESAIAVPANLSLLRNLTMMIAAGLLAIGIAWLLGRKILIYPLEQLITTMKAFSKGNLEARSGGADSRGELGALARAFDDMADRLVTSQKMLRSIADYTYDWEYWRGAEGNLLWMSPSCERITGYSADDFMADPNLINHIVDDGDKTLYSDHTLDETIRNHSKSMDFCILRKSGERAWINHHCIPIYDANGVFLGRRVSNRDITDRKNMEKALAQSEAQFRSLVEGAPEAIFVQTEFCFAYLNEAAVRLFGAASVEDLLGKPVMDRFHPDFRERVRERIEQLNTMKNRVSRLEQISLRLDGTPVQVETTAVPLTFKNKDGALVFIQDITERKQIEERLQQAQKMEAIGSLAGGIAHDFNNILFPILGLSEMLLEDLPENCLERDNVVEILRAAKRARDLVSQILSFSRQTEHKKIPLRIQQVLKEVVKLTRATIPSNIELQTNIEQDCGPVLADPTNIHQIAMNLVTNAFHAVEGNSGRIAIGLKVVSLGGEDAASLDIKAGPYALLTVSDTGTGIIEEVLPKIFNPYFTTKPQGKGTGMGLSVVFGIVKNHGGDIRVYSEVGKGSVFKVYLPLLEREPVSAVPETALLLPTGSEHLLVVDDEEQIMHMEKQLLERLGYKITMKSGSIDALDTFKRDPFAYDLVITDMAMPQMTGDELARQMIACRTDIPIILCTGFSEQITKSRAKAMGIKGFLMKPVLRAQMASEIRRVLDAKASVSLFENP